ncbi:MAG: chorismate mutase [Wujia sp.]
MELQEVRLKINKIDDEIKKLYNSRVECSKQVAQVKMEQNDEVFKPLREKEIYDRFSQSEEDRQYASLVKKIIQLSRKLQYSQFIEKKIIDSNFYDWISDMGVFDRGGELRLVLFADPEGEKGLDLKDILSIAADTDLILKNLITDAEGRVELAYEIPDEEHIRAEAFLLAYMLYKETIKKA